MSDLYKLSDKDAERAVLGSCIIDPDVYVDVQAIIGEDDFYQSTHRVIFKALSDLFEHGTAVDVLTLSDAIKAYSKLDDIGTDAERGTQYLTSLMTSDIYSYNAEHYASIVRELSHRRRVVLSCEKTATRAYDRTTPLTDTIELGAQDIMSVSMGGDGELMSMSSDFENYMLELAARTADPNKSPSGIPTGFADIDHYTNGLEKSKLWVIAGRPGMGKTALLTGLTYNLSVVRNLSCAIFSLEMSREELYKRLIAYGSRVDLMKIAKGDLNEIEKKRVNDVLQMLESAQERIFIDDTGNLTPSQIKARASRAMMFSDIDYLWLDFLQLINVPGASGGSQNYIQATIASREMKNIAKYLDRPVVVASQLNRGVEARTDKRPELHDLRDSGGIEEAADMVGLLYREAYYKKDRTMLSEDERTLAEFIIAKQRDGQSGVTINMRFFGEFAGYYNYAKEMML